MALRLSDLSTAETKPPVEASVHSQTQSHDPVSRSGSSVERTNEIACRMYEFLPSRTTESDRGSGPAFSLLF